MITLVAVKPLMENLMWKRTMRFCGAEVEQSVSKNVISISMNDFVKKVKPITVEKSRKTMVSNACEA